METYLVLAELFEDDCSIDADLVVKNVPGQIKDGLEEAKETLRCAEERIKICVELRDAAGIRKVCAQVLNVFNTGLITPNEFVHVLIPVSKLLISALLMQDFNSGVFVRGVTLLNKIFTILKPSEVYNYDKTYRIEFRPIWDYYIYLLEKIPEVVTRKNENNLKALQLQFSRFIVHARNYFRDEVREELFLISEPYLYPESLHYLKYVGLIALFFPSLQYDHTVKVDWGLHINRLINFTVPVDRLTRVDNLVLSVISRIAICNIGAIDWSPFIPNLFHIFIHASNGGVAEERIFPMSLVLDGLGVPSRCAIDVESLGSMLAAILVCAWNQANVMSYLTHFLSVNNDQLHSSVISNSMNIPELIFGLCHYFALRVHHERIGLHLPASISCLNLDESPFEITELCYPLVSSHMIYSQSPSVLALGTNSLQELLGLDPSHLVPLVWSKVIEDMECDDKPSRVAAAMTVLNRNLFKLLNIENAPMLGQYVRKCVSLLISSIDPFNNARVHAAITVLVMIFYAIPFVPAQEDSLVCLDSSELVMLGKKEVSAESQDEVRSFTLNMPELVFDLLEKLDLLILHQSSLDLTEGAENNQFYQLVLRLFQSVVFSVDPVSILPIVRTRAIRKALSVCISEISVPITLFYGALLQNILWADPVSGITDIVLPLIDALRNESNGFKFENLTEQKVPKINHLMKLLIPTLKFAGKSVFTIISVLEDLINSLLCSTNSNSSLTVSDKLKDSLNLDLCKSAGKLVGIVCNTILSIYPLERRSYNADDFNLMYSSSKTINFNYFNPLIRRHWFKWGFYSAEDLQKLHIEYHVPTKSDFSFVSEFLVKILGPKISYIETLINIDFSNDLAVSEWLSQVNSDKFLVTLSLVKRVIKGVQSCLGNWNGLSLKEISLPLFTTQELDKYGGDLHELIALEDKLLGSINADLEPLHEISDEIEELDDEEVDSTNWSDDDEDAVLLCVQGEKKFLKNGTLKIPNTKYSHIYPSFYVKLNERNEFETIIVSESENMNFSSLRSFFGRMLVQLSNLFLSHSKQLTILESKIRPTPIVQIISIFNKLLFRTWHSNPSRTRQESNMSALLSLQVDKSKGSRVSCRPWFVERCMLRAHARAATNDYRLKYSSDSANLILNVTEMCVHRASEVKGASLSTITGLFGRYPKSVNLTVDFMCKVLMETDPAVNNNIERILGVLTFFLLPTSISCMMSVQRVQVVIRMIFFMQNSVYSDHVIQSMVHLWFSQFISHYARTGYYGVLGDPSYPISFSENYSTDTIPNEVFVSRLKSSRLIRNKFITGQRVMIRYVLNEVWVDVNGISKTHWRYQLMGATLLSLFLSETPMRILIASTTISNYFCRCLFQKENFSLKQIAHSVINTILFSCRERSSSFVLSHDISFNENVLRELSNYMLVFDKETEIVATFPLSDSLWSSMPYLDDFCSGWKNLNKLKYFSADSKWKSFSKCIDSPSLLKPEIVNVFLETFIHQFGSFITFLQNRHKAIAEEALAANSSPVSSSISSTSFSKIFNQAFQGIQKGGSVKKNTIMALANFVSSSGAQLIASASTMGSGEQLESFVEENVRAKALYKFTSSWVDLNSRQQPSGYFDASNAIFVSLLVENFGVTMFESIYSEIKKCVMLIVEETKHVALIEHKQLLCAIAEILAGLVRFFVFAPPSVQSDYLVRTMDLFWICFEMCGLDSMSYFQDAVKWSVVSADPRRIRDYILVPVVNKLKKIVSNLELNNFSDNSTSSVSIEMQKCLLCLSSIVHESTWRLCFNRDINGEKTIATVLIDLSSKMLSFPSEQLRYSLATLITALMIASNDSDQKYFPVDRIVAAMTTPKDNEANVSKEIVSLFLNFVYSLQGTDVRVYSRYIGSIVGSLLTSAFPEGDAETSKLVQQLLGAAAHIRLSTISQVDDVLAVLYEKSFKSGSWRIRRLGVWFLDTFLKRHSHYLSAPSAARLKDYLFDVLLTDSSSELSGYTLKVLSRFALSSILCSPQNGGSMYYFLPYICTKEFSKVLSISSHTSAIFATFPTVWLQLQKFVAENPNKLSELTEDIAIDQVSNEIQSKFNVKWTNNGILILLTKERARQQSMSALFSEIKRWKSACKQKQYVKSDEKESEIVRKRFAGVLGLCSVVLSNPFTVPFFIPSLIKMIASLKVVDSSLATLKMVIREFKSSHIDKWDEQFKQCFSEDQLESLQDFDDSPSYIV